MPLLPLQLGETYPAVVRKMMDYGAFVELGGTGGTQSLLHISEMEAGRVRICHKALLIGGASVECHLALMWSWAVLVGHSPCLHISEREAGRVRTCHNEFLF